MKFPGNYPEDLFGAAAYDLYALEHVGLGLEG